MFMMRPFYCSDLFQFFVQSDLIYVLKTVLLLVTKVITNPKYHQQQVLPK